jgi:hypothetical protein
MNIRPYTATFFAERSGRLTRPGMNIRPYTACFVVRGDIPTSHAILGCSILAVVGGGPLLAGLLAVGKEVSDGFVADGDAGSELL